MQHYVRVVNVTISMDEKVARWVRIRAAERDTSMSRYLGDLLREKMEGESAYQGAMRGYLASLDWPMPTNPATPLPTRDELYDRPGLR